MSVFALNITPYITSSIIIQLLTLAIPALEEMHRDGEEGRKKMTAITQSTHASWLEGALVAALYVFMVAFGLGGPVFLATFAG